MDCERLLIGGMTVGFKCDVNGNEVSHTFLPSDLAGGRDGDIRVVACIGGNLELTTELACDPEQGIWHRRDEIVNSGERDVLIGHPVVEFSFSGGTISAWVQKSAWCAESQFTSVDATSGPVTIGSKGRSCSGYAPYIRISSDALGDVIIHHLPMGDWRAILNESDGKLSIAIDRFDDNESMTLRHGEQVKIKLDCLIQPVETDRWDKECYRVQAYAMDKLAKRRSARLPVVYDTWFDRFYKITIHELIAQLDAAAEAGCEVFVVDAGWYGAGGGNWHEMIGDWRENPDVFSEVTLSQFADLVRSKGLEFGIWMEPERVHKSAPVLRQNPDWFVESREDGFYYPDLVNLDARDWVLTEMCRVIDTYGIKWLDLDCNFDFSDDPHHTGHRLRTEAWHAILDKLAEKYPDLILEGCASGGLRNDLCTVSHYHTHFLTDTVDPIDTIRIGMAGLSRLWPAMMFRWAVINPTGSGFTPYGREPGDTGDLVLCPANATADKVSSYYLDFAIRSAMTGGLGLGGNIAGLCDELRRQLGEHIAFYKKQREFILSSVGIPLTPTETIDKRDGVSAIQLSSRDFERNMVFVYNMSSDAGPIRVRPVELMPAARYSVCSEEGCELCEPMLGVEILAGGIEVECPPNHARAIRVDGV